MDDDRKKALDIGAPYHLLQSTYLIAPGSTINSLAEANRSGVRIAIVDGTATGRASVSASPSATTVKVKNPDEAVELMRAGKLDAIALSRESVGGWSTRCRARACSTRRSSIPPPRWRSAKNRPAALAFVTEFIEEAKTQGLVRRALDSMGLKSSQVAPAGMKA